MSAHPMLKLVLSCVMILVFGVTGLVRIIWPDQFIRRSGGLNGSRTSVRCFGAIYIALVVFMIYVAFLAGHST
jgi:hypothetical protein